MKILGLCLLALAAAAARSPPPEQTGAALAATPAQVPSPEFVPAASPRFIYGTPGETVSVLRRASKGTLAV